MSETVEILYKNQNLEEGDLDLGELLSALWANKLLITLIISLSVFLSGYYALNTEKKFTSRAVFEISESNSGNSFKFPKEMGALVSIAGLGSSGNSSSRAESLLERVTGREFILNFNNKYSLDRDPYFNTYNPDYKDPYGRQL